MPYKSDAQRRFFHAAEARGDISKSTVNEFDEASKGKKLPEHVKKLYEGGMIDADEYADFQARYHTSEGEEQKMDQEHPDMGEESGSRHEPHQESPMPSEGHDYMTQEVGEEYHPNESDDAEITSREEFAKEIARERRRRMFRK